jgi:hypothetical protein
MSLNYFTSLESKVKGVESMFEFHDKSKKRTQKFSIEKNPIIQRRMTK